MLADARSPTISANVHVPIVRALLAVVLFALWCSPTWLTKSFVSHMLTNSRPSTGLTVPSDVVVLADARSLALLALGPCAIMLADAGPAT